MEKTNAVSSVIASLILIGLSFTSGVLIYAWGTTTVG